MNMVTSMFEAAQVEADSETERTCGTCGKRKPFSEFYRDGKDKQGNVRYRRDCKDCYQHMRSIEREAKKIKLKKGGRRR